MPNYINVNNLNLDSAAVDSNGIFSISPSAYNVVTGSLPVTISPIGIYTTVNTGFNVLSGVSAIDTVAINISACNTFSTTNELLSINAENVMPLNKVGDAAGLISPADSPFIDYEPTSIGFVNKTTNNYITIPLSSIPEEYPLKSIAIGYYTIEMWIKLAEAPLSVTHTFTLFNLAQSNTAGGAFHTRLQLLINSDRKVSLNYFSTSALAAQQTLTNNTQLAINQWYHVALSVGNIKPNEARIFVGGVGTGVLELSSLQTSHISFCNIGWNSNGLYANAFANGNGGFRGSISNFCYSYDCKYKQNFTPVFQPITPNTNTRILYKYPYDTSFIGVNYSNITTQYALSNFSPSQQTDTWVNLRLSSPLQLKPADLSSNVETISSDFRFTRFSFYTTTPNILTIRAANTTNGSLWTGHNILKLVTSSQTDRTFNISTTQLTSIDRVFVLGTHTSSSYKKFTLSAAAVNFIKNYHIGMGATFELPSNRNIVLNVSGVSGLQIGAGGSLISNNSSNNFSHIFTLSLCPISIEGSGYIELNGANKQKGLNLLSSTPIDVDTFTLTDTPSTWSPNDNILIYSNKANYSQGNLYRPSYEYLNILSTSTPSPKIIKTRTKTLFIHEPVSVIPDIINLTRNIRISSIGVAGSPGWITINNNASALINNVEFYGLSSGTAGRQGIFINNTSESNIVIDSCSFRGEFSGAGCYPITFNLSTPVFNLTATNNSFCKFNSLNAVISLRPTLSVYNSTFNNNTIAANIANGMSIDSVVGLNFYFQNNIFADNNQGVIIANLSTSEASAGDIIGYSHPLHTLNITNTSTKITNVHNVSCFYSNYGVTINSMTVSSLNISNMAFSGVITIHFVNAGNAPRGAGLPAALSLTNITCSALNIDSIFGSSSPTNLIRFSDYLSNQVVSAINTNITNISSTNSTGAAHAIVMPMVNALTSRNATLNINNVFTSDLGSGHAVYLANSYHSAVNISNIQSYRCKASNTINIEGYNPIETLNISQVTAVDIGDKAVYVGNTSAVTSINLTDINVTNAADVGIYIDPASIGINNTKNLTINVSSINLSNASGGVYFYNINNPTLRINLDKINIKNDKGYGIYFTSIGRNTIITAKDILVSATSAYAGIAFQTISAPITLIDFTNVSSSNNKTYSLLLENISSIQNFNITDSLFAHATTHNIFINNITGINTRFNNISVYNSNGDGISIQTPASVTTINPRIQANIDINNSFFSNNKSDGLFVDRLYNVNININKTNFLNNSGANVSINNISILSSLSASNLRIEHNTSLLTAVPAAAVGMSISNCNSSIKININNNIFNNLGGGIHVNTITSLPEINLTDNLFLSSRGIAVSISSVSSLNNTTGNILLSSISAIGHITHGIHIDSLSGRFNINLNNNLMSSCSAGILINNIRSPLTTITYNLTALSNFNGISLQNITAHNSIISAFNITSNFNRNHGFIVSGVSGVNDIIINNCNFSNNRANGLIAQNLSSPTNILVNLDSIAFNNNNQNGILIQNISRISALQIKNSTLSNNISAGIFLANLSSTSSHNLPISTNFVEITANNNLIGLEAYNITTNISSVVFNDNIAHGIKAKLSDGNTEIRGLTSLMQYSTAANTTSIIFNTNSSAGDFITSDFSPSLSLTENLYNSVYFHNNKSSFAYINNTAQLNLSSNNFTIEAWIYVKEVAPTDGGLIVGVDDGVVRVADTYCTRTAPGRGFSNWGLYIENNYKLNFSALLFDNEAAGGWNGIELEGPTITKNIWNYIALTRSGDTFRLYVNGVQGATITKAITIPHRSDKPLRTCSWTIQTRPTWANNSCTPPSTITDTVDAYLNGYMSNLRITVGQALYTQTTHPIPTEPLTTTSQGALPANVALLAFQNIDPFKDNSQYNTRIETNASSTIMGVHSAPVYPTATDKWSCYLGQNTNSIDLPTSFNGILLPFANRTKSFEAWVYFKSVTATSFISNFAAGSVQGRYSFGTNSDNTLNFAYSTNTTVVTAVSSNIPIKTNEWTHIAITIDATTSVSSKIRFFTNGNMVERAADLSSHTVLASNTKIGGVATINNNTIYNNVLISNLHLSKQLLYTQPFTPILAAIAPTSNTVLLTFNNNRFTDRSSNNFALTITNTPVIEWSSPFISPLSGSFYFNGYSDFITISSSDLALPIGRNIPFTIEAWVFPTEHKFDSTYITDSGSTLHNVLALANSTNKSSHQSDTSLVFGYYSTTWTLARGVEEMVLYKWHHIAATYTGSQALLFLNGKLIATADIPIWVDKNVNTMFIGKRWEAATSTSPNIYFCGYMTNIRYIRGTALYRGNFIPQIDNFKCINNTKFLVAAEHGKKFIYTNHNNLQSNIYLVSSINSHLTVIKDSIIGGVGEYNAPAIVFEENHLSNFYLNTCIIQTSALNIDFVSGRENNSGSYIFNINTLSNPDSINWGLMRGYRDNTLYDRGISISNYNNIPFSNKRILPAGVISSITEQTGKKEDILERSTVSEKVQPMSVNRNIKSSSKYIPVRKNDLITLSVYVKKSYTPMYAGSSPQLILNQNLLIGYNRTVLYTHSLNNGEWEKYIVNLPIPTEDGIAEIYVECAGDDTKGYININGWTISKQ